MVTSLLFAEKNVFIWEKSFTSKIFFTEMEKTSFTEKNIYENVKNMYLI